MPYTGKKATKYHILNHMLNHGDTSKVELAKQLNLSMPTVLSNVNELMEIGIVAEKGEMESTGGRKAVLIGLNSDYRYALGVDLTANHLGIVLVNLCGEILKQERIRFKFDADLSYYTRLAEHLRSYFSPQIAAEQILGSEMPTPNI